MRETESSYLPKNPPALFKTFAKDRVKKWGFSGKVGLRKHPKPERPVTEILALLHNLAPVVSATILQIQWIFFTSQLQKPEHEYIAAGDEVVFGKAGKETHGLGHFFSGLQNRVIPGLSFFTFSVIDVQERQSYPIQAVQMVKAKEKNSQKGKASRGPSERQHE